MLLYGETSPGPTKQDVSDCKLEGECGKLKRIRFQNGEAIERSALFFGQPSEMPGKTWTNESPSTTPSTSFKQVLGLTAKRPVESRASLFLLILPDDHRIRFKRDR